MTKIRRAQKFTLVELVAALSVLVSVSTLVAGAVGVFFTAYTQGVELGNKLDRSRRLSRLADRLLAGAVPFVWTDRDEETEKSVFYGRPHELTAACLNRAYGSEGGLLFARLYQDGDRLVCGYSTVPILHWEDAEMFDLTTEVVADNVAEVNFLYFNLDSDRAVTAVDAWDEDYAYTIPLAIQLEVIFNDGSRERRLRRTAGSSGHSSLGYREEALE